MPPPTDWQRSNLLFRDLVQHGTLPLVELPDGCSACQIAAKMLAKERDMLDDDCCILLTRLYTLLQQTVRQLD